jgi:hypothetical protein
MPIRNPQAATQLGVGRLPALELPRFAVSGKLFGVVVRSGDSTDIIHSRVAPGGRFLMIQPLPNQLKSVLGESSPPRCASC